MGSTIDSKIAQGKLIILLMIKKSNNNITIEQLTSLILEYDLLNHFNFIQYFSELIENNMVDISNEPNICIKELGLESLQWYGNSIDNETLELIDEIFTPRQTNEREYLFDIVEKNDVYILDLYVENNVDQNFKLSISFDDLKKAEEIGNYWKEDSELVYQHIITILKEAVE